MKKIYLILLTIVSSTVFSQEVLTPLQKNNYSKVTSYDEISDFVQYLTKTSKLFSYDTIGKSVQGRNLYAMKFSSSEVGKDTSKIKVLILAQQHGNEQSGKEGALQLASELVKPENQYLFDKIDLVIVPQMNPDGSEVNNRRNGNDADLNRNHLVLTEPEVIAVHQLFDQFLFDVTMDVHEYYPFGETWKSYGYRDNSDLLLGCNTNTNITDEIISMSNNSFIPFMNKFLNDKNISNFIYTPGGPPEINYIRKSTYDINDGRQSFGIQGTFSFIQEGMNGPDGYIDSIRHRSESQMAGMRGLLEYAYLNKEVLKNIVVKSRKSLIHDSNGKNIGIQMEHVNNGEILKLPVYSYFSGNDSIINVIDYREIVKSIYDVKKPFGYLIPKQLNEIIEWLDRHNISYNDYNPSENFTAEQYYVSAIDSIDFEGDIVVNPTLDSGEVKLIIDKNEYVFVSTNQLKSDMIVIGLEPKSELGLVTYKMFSHLIKVGDTYPIFRVVKDL